MSKLDILITGLIASCLFTLVGLALLENGKEAREKDKPREFRVLRENGHDFLIHQMGVLHSPDCPCSNPQPLEK